MSHLLVRAAEASGAQGSCSSEVLLLDSEEIWNWKFWAPVGCFETAWLSCPKLSCRSLREGILMVCFLALKLGEM